MIMHKNVKKKKYANGGSHSRKNGVKMAHPSGFEPETADLEDRNSILLSYGCGKLLWIDC